MRWPKWFWDLRDAWRVDQPSGQPVFDPLLGTFAADEPYSRRKMTPQESARIRKVIADTMEDSREGRAWPRCEDHLDGMDGAAVFFCDRSSGHGGFHRDRENKVTWVSDSGGK